MGSELQWGVSVIVMPLTMERLLRVLSMAASARGKICVQCSLIRSHRIRRLMDLITGPVRRSPIQFLPRCLCREVCLITCRRLGRLSVGSAPSVGVA